MQPTTRPNRSPRWLALLASLAVCAPAAAADAPAAFSFALLGDAPYSTADEPRLAKLLEHIDADPSVRFVLHAGDLKAGREPCADALLRRRIGQFDRLLKAVVYTPGDNEWTDCHVAAAGRFDPLERLSALRRLAFADPHRSLGRQPLAVAPQADRPGFAEFVENLRFTSGRVLFVTLHVVGSNNGLEPWRGIDATDALATPRPARLAAFVRRQAANLAWLQEAFAQAAADDSIAVVVLMQANPRFELAENDADRAGFNAIIERLHALAAHFARPVLLAHGDRHFYLVDRPLADAAPAAANLLRVQTFGAPWLGWVRIDVDPARTGVFEVSAGDRPGSM